MAQPFTDFAIPPLLHSATLVVGCTIVLSLLWVTRPPVNQRTVVAFVPWIVSGAALHVFYQLGEIYQVQIYPPEFEPLFSAPAVYATTFLVMGIIWILSVSAIPPDKMRTRGPLLLGLVGFGVSIPLLGLVVFQGQDPQVAPMEPTWPFVALGLAVVSTALVYFLLGYWRTYVIARARMAGAVVIFAHLFDAITTAIGYDILDVGERSAIPRVILEFSADLPTAETLGAGWLFVLFKLIMACAIVVYFADDLKRHEKQTNILFAIVAAVGLGPASYNFLLFVLSPW